MLVGSVWSGSYLVVCFADDAHGFVVLWSYFLVGLTAGFLQLIAYAVTVKHCCFPASDGTAFFHHCMSIGQFICCFGCLNELMLQ